MARWDEGHKEPWLIVTELAAAGANVAWYGLRSWIEGGYKDIKRGGWHWEQTKQVYAERAARQCLAIAVASLWVVSVGGLAETELPESGLADLPPQHIARRIAKSKSRARLISCFRRGVLKILAGLLAGKGLVIGYFVPEGWAADEQPPAEQADVDQAVLLAAAAAITTAPQLAAAKTYP